MDTTTSLLSVLEQLPDPSEATPRKDLVISTLAQCHGCGNDFEKPSLKRCTACKRVYYCSKSCQSNDYKKPRKHKECCHPGLLTLAMDNIRRLPIEEKMAHMAAGNVHLIPNSHFCHTVAKVSCPSVSDFLQCARREYILVRDNLCSIRKKASEAATCAGNCQYDLMDQNRYGLDVGVEALCAAINMWPGVYTISSCSGLHSGAWMPTGPESYFCSDFVQFVSDDADALNHIQAIFERGGFGIRYQSNKMDGTSDPIGRQDGFVVIDCDLGDGYLPKKCRTYGRAVSWTSEPFDKLDAFLWMMTNTEPPLQRMQNNLIGFLGVAFELVRANPSLDLSEENLQELKQMEKPMMMFRKMLIEITSKRLNLTMQQQGEVPLASSMAKIVAEMHQRVTALSVFDTKEPQQP